MGRPDANCALWAEGANLYLISDSFYLWGFLPFYESLAFSKFFPNMLVLSQLYCGGKSGECKMLLGCNDLREGLLSSFSQSVQGLQPLSRSPHGDDGKGC